jgi:hypothetical protein
MLRAVLILCLGLTLIGLAPLLTWPAAAQTSEAQIVIERPLVNATTGIVVQINGWAVDPSGPHSGVDAVHIYLDGEAGAPRARFLGPASYGLARPDVASHLGDARFTNSGFAMVTELPPGVHSLYVYAHALGAGPQDGWSRAVLQNFEVSLIRPNPTVVQPGPAATTDGVYRTGQAYQGGGTCLRYTGAGNCDASIPFGIATGASCMQWNQRGQCTSYLPAPGAVIQGAPAAASNTAPNAPAASVPLSVPPVTSANPPRPSRPAVRVVAPPLESDGAPAAEEPASSTGSSSPVLPAASPPGAQ